jgi:DNA-directed RNA polymerase subunit M/transcription elongation factor TFIIS
MRMENQAAVAVATEITFHCRHCNSPLVVGAAAAGLVLDCRKCGKPVTVPQPAVARSSQSDPKVVEIQNRLKENESQRTEITGYINQAQIQLHRWQLRLQSLNERKAELEAELRKIG